MSEDSEKTNESKSTKKPSETKSTETINRKNNLFPPFSIKSILELPWGLNLEFSNDKENVPIGKYNREKIYENVIFKYLGELGDKNNDQEFIENLFLSLSKTMNNLGFIRSNHMKYVAELETEINAVTTKHDNRANLASFGTDGIVTKLLSFMGGGSLITVLDSTLFSFTKNNFDSKVAQIDKLIDLTNKINQTNNLGSGHTAINHTSLLTNVTQSIGKEINDNLIAQSIENTGYDIALFTGVGIVSMLIINLYFQKTKKSKKNKERLKLNKIIQDYLEQSFRPKAIKILLSFYLDVKRLIILYYLDNKTSKFDEILRKENLIEKDVPEEKNDGVHSVKFFIESEIIPKYMFEYVFEENPEN